MIKASQGRALAGVRTILAEHVRAPAELRMHASDAGLDLSRLTLDGQPMVQLIHCALEEFLRLGDFARLWEFCARAIGPAPTKPPTEKVAKQLRDAREYLEVLGWRPVEPPHPFLLALQAGDWFAARRALNEDPLPGSDAVRAAVEALIDPWHTLCPAFAPTPTDLGAVRWLGELEHLLFLRAQVRLARDFSVRWGCELAERRLEVMEMRLRLATIHRTHNPMMGTSPYQSILRRVRDGHPGTAARIAWLWGAALVVETGCLPFDGPAQKLAWSRPAQLVGRVPLEDELTLLRGVIAELQPADRFLGQWLRALLVCINAGTPSPSRSHGEVSLADLRAGAPAAPSDLDVSLLQCLVNAGVASELREAIEKTPRPSSTHPGVFLAPQDDA